MRGDPGEAAVNAAPATVLHVVEAWQGGVQTIVRDYARAVPEMRHLLLTGDRDGYQVTDAEEDLFDGAWRMPPGHFARVRETGMLYRDQRPDVVHAHSSLAGGYVRLALSVPRHRIVYTPHCYAMERTDLAPYGQAAVWTAERLLSWRTGIVAGSSPREVELAHALRKRQPTVYVPNVVRPQESGPDSSHDGLPPRSIAMVGRLCTQKDPGFFADAAAEGRRLMPSSNWFWLGDGEPHHRKRLEQAGVTVTGWLDHHDIQHMLAQASVYAHCARWEGAPMTLLEAVGLGRPVVARRIPALESLGVPDLVDTPQELAAAAVALLTHGPAAHTDETQARLYAEHSPARQRTMLRQAYGR
ncbi:glycosyltransferase family 4 protein [Streptomyces sp. NPDC050844]|uniref:glycosyltransferase family 4 protein n=1 Tax=Streptomyces sp. NPDC050844 TaxID=3155790 RepID=UPI0033F9C9E9